MRLRLQKPLLITTPLFYVNSTPHIGHLYSMLVADALRIHHGAALLTGTDEHGIKVFQSANGRDPAKYCERMSGTFRRLADSFIKYDTFVRTTDQAHIERVRSNWSKLVAGNRIHKATYTGYYCQTEEAFVNHHTDQYVEEENYFFSLDKDLANSVIDQPDLAQFRADLKKKRMEGLCVSRPRNRQVWGIPVPGDDNNMIYVWLDALSGYLREEPVSYKHVIGKDIVRFHAVYWPCLLKALENESEVGFMVHSHWIKDNAKMSKSLRNVVDPFKLLEQYTPAQIRLYFLTQGPQNSDANFDENQLKKCWNEFIDKFNNTVCRLITPKIVKPNQLLLKIDRLEEEHSAIIEQFNQVVALYVKQMNSDRLIEGYESLKKLFSLVNLLVDREAPWSQTDEFRKEQVVSLSCVLISIIQAKLRPFITQKPIVDKAFEEFPTEKEIPITVNLGQDLFMKKFKL